MPQLTAALPRETAGRSPMRTSRSSRPVQAPRATGARQVAAARRGALALALTQSMRERPGIRVRPGRAARRGARQADVREAVQGAAVRELRRQDVRAGRLRRPVCGTCKNTETCAVPVAGKACNPSCTGKTCGPDGCGGQCGMCSGTDVCKNNSCVCTPNCAGKVCGTDGCGGTCGPGCNATLGEVCTNGACKANVRRRVHRLQLRRRAHGCDARVALRRTPLHVGSC